MEDILIIQINLWLKCQLGITKVGPNYHLVMLIMQGPSIYGGQIPNWDMGEQLFVLDVIS